MPGSSAAVMPYRSKTSLDARVPAPVWWGVVCATAAYVTYLGILIACDALRVESVGLVLQYGPGGATVARVEPGTAAARYGIAPGDRVLRANGQHLQGPVDWLRVRAHLDPARPLQLEVARAGVPMTIPLSIAAGLRQWRTGPARPGLVAFRLVEVITLGFALLVGLRRTSDPTALLGALLLAAFATVSLVLPIRFFLLWQALPQPLEALLWLPYATSAFVGPLLFAFFAVFPRRIVSLRLLALMLLPGMAASAWFVYVGYHLGRPPGPPTGLPDLTVWVFLTSIAYALAAVVLLLMHRREARGLTDRRRSRVLMGGLLMAAAGSTALLVMYRFSGGTDIFGNPILTVLALFFLAGPASFAYAILRHQLFDLRFIVRQGVRYALARRLVDALIPTIVTLLLVELFLRRNRPLGEAVQSGWLWYAGVVVALIIVRRNRDAWLQALDRRFFRERYDANRLLENVVTQINLASSLDAIAPSVAKQIDEALHPAFVEILRHVPGQPVFGSVTASSLALPVSLRTIAVLTALRQPLTLSQGDTAWVRHQLPGREREILADHGIELLVPAFDEQERGSLIALIAMGPKKSEEPYNADDLRLLATIGAALGTLGARHPDTQRGFLVCSRCGSCYDDGSERCAADDTVLAAVKGSRVLSSRYRLDQQLGRGGMGTVYAAVDAVLERRVAVKLIREDLIAPSGAVVDLGLPRRFLREARAAARLAHQNVVHVYDFGVDAGDRAFLVMELLVGDTLRQRLQAGTMMSPGQTLAIMREICKALAAAHEQGLVHRDLKPENIFLHRGEGGVVPKLLDFGLAKALETARNANDTSVGVLIGTLEYMAPEQVVGGEVSASWDLWALGVIAYEMLTGRHPFRHILPRDTPPNATTDVINSAPEPPAPAWLRATVLSPDPAKRPASARALLAAFEQVLQ